MQVVAVLQKQAMLVGTIQSAATTMSLIQGSVVAKDAVGWCEVTRLVAYILFAQFVGRCSIEGNLCISFANVWHLSGQDMSIEAMNFTFVVRDVSMRH